MSKLESKEFEEISTFFSFSTKFEEFLIYENCVDKSGLQIDTNHLLKTLVGDLVLDTIGRSGRLGL